MYVCMYVYMYVCMYVCMHVYLSYDTGNIRALNGSYNTWRV